MTTFPSTTNIDVETEAADRLHCFSGRVGRCTSLTLWARLTPSSLPIRNQFQVATESRFGNLRQLSATLNLIQACLKTQYSRQPTSCNTHLMWAFAKKLLAKSQVFNQALGDVVFETPEVQGSTSHSFFQWRIKQSVEGGAYFVALRMRPDSYAGMEGSPTNYMNFDIATAQRLKSDLERCISEYHRLSRNAPAGGT